MHLREFSRLSNAKKLVRHGVTPLFDKWCLPPGRIFQREIEHVFPMVRCVAIFIGSRGIGPWEEVETRIAIDEATKRTIPIIPVLLPDTSAAPGIIQTTSAIVAGTIPLGSV